MCHTADRLQVDNDDYVEYCWVTDQCGVRMRERGRARRRNLIQCRVKQTNQKCFLSFLIQSNCGRARSLAAAIQFRISLFIFGWRFVRCAWMLVVHTRIEMMLTEILISSSRLEWIVRCSAKMWLTRAGCFCCHLIHSFYRIVFELLSMEFAPTWSYRKC